MLLLSSLEIDNSGVIGTCGDLRGLGLRRFEMVVKNAKKRWRLLLAILARPPPNTIPR